MQTSWKATHETLELDTYSYVYFVLMRICELTRKDMVIFVNRQKSVNLHKSTIEMQVDISEYQTEYCTNFSRIVWVDPGAISELPYVEIWSVHFT